MSAHVVVIDATARRATIKTTPGKHLTDILQEACSKLGYNSSQYGLKYVTMNITYFARRSNQTDNISPQAQPQATRPLSFLPSFRSQLRSKAGACTAIPVSFCCHGRATASRVGGPRGTKWPHNGQVPKHDNPMAGIAQV
jgi:hypothetical protein